jgi:hypothetical protein
MIAFPIPLTSELEHFSLDLEHRSQDAQYAAERRNVEESMALSMHLYDRLMRHHQQWTDRIDEKIESFDMDKARDFERGFHTWAAAARLLLTQAAPLEKKGLYIEQASELRRALFRCPYDGISVDQLVASSQALVEGKGISAAELRHELQARLRAEGR